MKLADKEFGFYWGVIKIPLAVLVLWSVTSLVVAIVSYPSYKSIFSNVAGIIIGIAVYGFIGWTTVKDHKGEVKQAAWAGALTGIIAGLIGAFISLLMISMVPQVVQDAVAQAVQRGAPAETVRNLITIGAYIGFVSGPVIGAIMGAIISSIGALIGKKVK